MSWKKLELLDIVTRKFELTDNIPEIIKSRVLTTIGNVDDEDLVTWDEIERDIREALSERDLVMTEDQVIELVKTELGLSDAIIELENPNLVKIKEARERRTSRENKERQGRWGGGYE